MLFSVEQAFVGTDEIRAPLKTPAWEATLHIPGGKITVLGNKRDLRTAKSAKISRWKPGILLSLSASKDNTFRTSTGRRKRQLFYIVSGSSILLGYITRLAFQPVAVKNN